MVEGLMPTYWVDVWAHAPVRTTIEIKAFLETCAALGIDGEAAIAELRAGVSS